MIAGLRVLVLGDHFGYPNGVVHGVTTWFLNVLPRLEQAGAEVRCCFLRESHPAAERLRAAGIEVDFLDVAKWNPFVARQAARIAAAFDARLIHAVGMKSTLAARLVARRRQIPVVFHSHDLHVPPTPVRFLNRLLRGSAERGLAVSAAAAALMPRAYGVRAEDVMVLPNGVEVDQAPRSADDRPAELPTSGPLLLWVGRLHEIKGPLRMIAAMPQVLKLRPDAQLAIAGDGPQRADCEALRARLGLEGSVTLLGQRSDVPALLKYASLLCITSVSEGFSLVAAEAAAAGVPAVAYDVGGLAEVVVDGRTGVLVPDDDAAGFAAAVATLLGNETQRAQMGCDAMAHVRQFSMQEHVSRLLTAYRGLMAHATPL
jgi:glycosyltransferase involved in cell wall biosynthesis